MARVSCSITKDFAYRGTREQFSNVYTYEVPNAGLPEASNLIGALQSIEKKYHSAGVNFVSGRVWTTGGTKEQNETILISDLSGAGELSEEPRMHAQAVYECQWRTDRPSATGKPVYCRKYLRLFSTGGAIFTDGMFAGSTPLPTAILSRLQDYMDSLNPLVVSGGSYAMVAPSGRVVNQRGVGPKYLSLHELRY